MNVKTFWFLVGSSLKMRKNFILGETKSQVWILWVRKWHLLADYPVFQRFCIYF